MKIKIHVFHTGEVGVDPAVPFRDTSKKSNSLYWNFSKPQKSKDELSAVTKGQIRYSNRLFKDINIKTFEMEPSKYGPFNRSYDVFGDRTVLMVNIKGHSQGTAATLIQNNGKFVLLTADCGYAIDSLENMRLKTLQLVRDMVHKENCIKIIANHYPEIEPQTIEL